MIILKPSEFYGRNLLLLFVFSFYLQQPKYYVFVSGLSLKMGRLFQAQEDAEKLRSVVMPMEQEIAALKAKLSSAEDRVKELEASKVSQEYLVFK